MPTRPTNTANNYVTNFGRGHWVALQSPAEPKAVFRELRVCSRKGIAGLLVDEHDVLCDGISWHPQRVCRKLGVGVSDGKPAQHPHLVGNAGLGPYRFGVARDGGCWHFPASGASCLCDVSAEEYGQDATSDFRL